MEELFKKLRQDAFKFACEEFPECYNVETKPFKYEGGYAEYMIPLCSVWIEDEFIGNVCIGGYADQQVGATSFFRRLTNHLNTKTDTVKVLW